MYKVKEIYYTLQGEGFHTGRAAIFCRFSGCNLWSGREEDRHKAICKFCDTDFWGTNGKNGGSYTAEQLVEKCYQLWPDKSVRPFIVCTGGEPLLQLDEALINAFHDKQFFIAIETNGTIKAPEGIDWICVSPKANTQLEQTCGNELKLVYPQTGQSPSDFTHLDFDHFYLQPMDSPELEKNTKLAVRYCTENPVWKLSLQVHKILGID